MQLTAFNRDELKSCLKPLIKKAFAGRTNKEVDLYSNTLDCFSAVVDSVILNITIEQWLELEAQRQTQKTLQNIMGDIHEAVLASSREWEKLGRKIVDLVNHNKKIIAEIKNKYSTTKGNHKVKIYDNLKNVLSRPEYNGYTGYYVEILPPTGSKEYDIPFTPPDNENDGTHRPENDHIRKIDGRSFHKLVTGEKDALDQFYYALPSIVAEILTEEGLINDAKERINNINPQIAAKIFKKAYG